MKNVLLTLFLLGIVSVCFADGGEVNEREFQCSKMGHLAKQIVIDRDAGTPKEEMIAEFTALYDQMYGESDLKTKLLEYVGIVYDDKEDKTPSAAYATQYTRCLTKGYFEY